MTRPTRVVRAFPLATQAQGDGGNAIAISHRLALRGFACQIDTVDRGQLPDADIILIGGLDESGLTQLTNRLREGGLAARVAAGATVIGVNAGFVALGETFEDEGGRRREGLGLLPMSFTRGDVVNRPVIADSVAFDAPTISAYESRQSHPVTAPESPFASVTAPDGVQSPEGCFEGKVIGTFLHGPLLARNPLLTDAIVAKATGFDLAEAPEGWAGTVRRQRLAEDTADPSGWGGMRYGRTVRGLLRSALRR